jgi:hypothetical protein
MGGQGLVNGRKLSGVFGLLRNSTKIAAQFLGLEQSSQKAPENTGKLKPRPYGSPNPVHPSALISSR